MHRQRIQQTTVNSPSADTRHQGLMQRNNPRYMGIPLGAILRSTRGGSSLGLVPFPRVGKRAASMGLAPFPRVGRTKSLGLVPFPRVGRAKPMGLVPFPRVGRSDPSLAKKQSLIPYPRIGKKSSLEELGDAVDMQSAYDDAEDDLELDADIETIKRNWATPRLGGYKRTSGARAYPNFRQRPSRADSSLVPRLGGE